MAKLIVRFSGIILLIYGANAMVFAEPGRILLDISRYMVLAGIGLILLSAVLGTTPKTRNVVFLNFFKAAVGALSFFAMCGGMMVVVFYYLGHMEDLRPWLPHGFTGLVAGIFGFYYGYAYQQSAVLVQIAGEIGFVPAETGPGKPDGEYDIKGVLNEVETLADLAEDAKGRSRTRFFVLRILCRVRNPLNILLRAATPGLVEKILNKENEIPGWEWFSVKTSDMDAALKVLPPARRENDNVFDEKYGFSFMELKGREFLFSFTREGYFEREYGKDYLLKVAGECSALAAKFN